MDNIKELTDQELKHLMKMAERDAMDWFYTYIDTGYEVAEAYELAAIKRANAYYIELQSRAA